jgi:hypothetical protein
MACLRRFALPLLAGLLLAGCPDNTPDTGGTGPGDVSDEALSFGGSISGGVSGTSDTGSSLDDLSTAQAINEDLSFLTGAVGWLEDLDGNRLLDANGEPYPDIEFDENGEFELDGLPVGVEIQIRIDVDGDGEPDLSTIINIPAIDEQGEAGELNGVLVDPLTSLTCARVIQDIVDEGLVPGDVETGLAAIIEQVRDAFEHLLEDQGIDVEILIADLLARDVSLADLFELHVPRAAWLSLNFARGKFQLENADDVEAVLQAVTPILVQGGFVIADFPGGIDFSFLEDVTNVEVLDFAEYFGSGPPGFDDVIESGRGRPSIDQSAFDIPGPGEGPVLYHSTAPEVNRNYVDLNVDGRRFNGPLFGEDVLIRLAEIYLDDGTLTLGDLYTVLTDPRRGFGLRFTYPGTGPFGQPVDVYQGPEDEGVELDTRAFIERLDALGLLDPDPDNVEQNAETLRTLLRRFLSPTSPPPLEALFAGILQDPVPSAVEFTQTLRDLRAHLPFSVSGPAQLLVIGATPPPDSEPVTVDLTLDDKGRIESVQFNEAGNGTHWLGFGPLADDGIKVLFVDVTTGRPLHDFHGRLLQQDIADDDIFQPVDGDSFVDAFSEQSPGLPLAPRLRLQNPEFDPSVGPDPSENPPDLPGVVLLVSFEPDAAPVRVTVEEDGSFVYDPDGEWYVLDPASIPGEDGDPDPDDVVPEAQQFVLITEDGQIREEIPGDPETRVYVTIGEIEGLEIPVDNRRAFDYAVVENPSYDPLRAPFFDDIDRNGVQDDGEPAFDFRYRLANPEDWRSTLVEMYYRRGDNDEYPEVSEIHFGADAPQLLDGTPLVPRNFRPRLNAWRFGQPNLSSTLITTFSAPDFFNGMHALDEETDLNVWQALAITHLVFTAVHNIEAVVDWDGPEGPQSPHTELLPANLFSPPVGDPSHLWLQGIEFYVETE